MACVKGLEEILRRRLKNLSEKNEAKDSGRDVSRIVDGVRWCLCEVVRIVF